MSSGTHYAIDRLATVLKDALNEIKEEINDINYPTDLSREQIFMRILPSYKIDSVLDYKAAWKCAGEVFEFVEQAQEDILTAQNNVG